MYKSSFESFEPRRLFSVFTQDLNYHPAGPFDAPSNIFITPVSKGRFLLAGTEDGPPMDRDGPNPITVISRVMSDGSLDPTFGKKGQLVFDESGQNVVFTGSRILLTEETNASHDTRSILAFTVNGKPDESYGGGDGQAEISVLPPDNSDWLDADCTIVKTYDDGSVLTLNEVFIVAAAKTKPNRFELVKTKPDGSLDTTFGDQGRIVLADTKTSEVTALVTATSLYVYVDNGGLTNPPSAQLTRYDPDGTLDTNFGTNGTVSVATFNSGFAEQLDGKLVYVAPSGNDSALHRLKTDGSPDTSFGTAGVITLHNPSHDLLTPLPASVPLGDSNPILIDNQNRITVAANDTIYRFSQSGTLDAYPYDGTAPFNGVNLSYNQQGDLLVGGTFGARFSLLPNTQLTSDGVAHVIGTNDDDVITVAPASGGKIRFTVNGDAVDLAAADVKGINVQLYDGNNSLNVSVDLPVFVQGGQKNDSITTAGGNDSIFANSGSDVVNLGDGDDLLDVGEVAETTATHTIIGGNGKKNISVDGGNATITLGDGDSSIDVNPASVDTHVTVGNGNDTLTLAGKDATLVAGNGNNTVQVSVTGHADITTGDGNDTIGVATADAIVHSNGGDDFITLSSTDANTAQLIFAGAGNDRVQMGFGTTGPATIHGGDGNDTLMGAATGQSLYGEGGKDYIDGGDGPDYISGGGGNDTLNGSAGNDVIYGGPGDDRIDGGNGNDNLSGQDGRDLIHGSAGDDHLYGGASSDSLYADGGNDHLYGEGGDDRLYADDATGRATLFGGAGNDQFVTRDGLIDVLYGDGGTDKAVADARDILTSIEF